LKARDEGSGLTVAEATRRLRLVHRLLACLLVALLIGPWGQALPQHVHAGGDHAHPEHEHGPTAHAHAAHKHGHEVPADDIASAALHIESCDVGNHSRSTVLAAACALMTYAAVAATASPTCWLAPPMSAPVLSSVTDTRVHDPPSRTPSSPRAPPLSIPA
jgi:hypothetical protein